MHKDRKRKFHKVITDIADSPVVVAVGSHSSEDCLARHSRKSNHFHRSRHYLAVTTASFDHSLRNTIAATLRQLVELLSCQLQFLLSTPSRIARRRRVQLEGLGVLVAVYIECHFGAEGCWHSGTFALPWMLHRLKKRDLHRRLDRLRTFSLFFGGQ